MPMFRSVTDQITAQRSDTRNKSDTSSIPQRDFVRWNQHAQDYLIALITKEYNWTYIERIDINLVANQSQYTIADNLAFGTRITQVELSRDGTENNFRPLPVMSNIYRRQNTPGRVQEWRRIHGAVEVNPPPSDSLGKLRVEYERTPDRLDITRGVINATPVGAILVLSAALSTESQEDIAAGTYVCISDASGTPLLYNGLVSSINGAATQITLAANVNTYLLSGVTLANLANGILTFGKYTVPYSPLPNEAEPFIFEYVIRRCAARDLKKNVFEIDQSLKDLANNFMAAFHVPDKTVKRIPVDDWQMMIPGYE